MSKFSGKCDFCDTVMIHGPDVIINDYRVYVGGQIVPLAFAEVKDLIPYYPYIVSMMSCNHNGGVIWLSEESWVDKEERDLLKFELSNAIKLWRKCKRKKVSFAEESEKCWTLFSRKKEIVQRVAEKGDKATIEDIHLEVSEHYRKLLYDEMVENGWDEYTSFKWCYGWRRAYDGNFPKPDTTDYPRDGEYSMAAT